MWNRTLDNLKGNESQLRGELLGNLWECESCCAAVIRAVVRRREGALWALEDLGTYSWAQIPKANLTIWQPRRKVRTQRFGGCHAPDGRQRESWIRNTLQHPAPPSPTPLGAGAVWCHPRPCPWSVQWGTLTREYWYKTASECHSG